MALYVWFSRMTVRNRRRGTWFCVYVCVGMVLSCLLRQVRRMPDLTDAQMQAAVQGLGLSCEGMPACRLKGSAPGPLGGVNHRFCVCLFVLFVCEGGSFPVSLFLVVMLCSLCVRVVVWCFFSLVVLLRRNSECEGSGSQRVGSRVLLVFRGVCVARGPRPQHRLLRRCRCDHVILVMLLLLSFLSAGLV